MVRTGLGFGHQYDQGRYFHSHFTAARTQEPADGRDAAFIYTAFGTPGDMDIKNSDLYHLYDPNYLFQHTGDLRTFLRSCEYPARIPGQLFNLDRTFCFSELVFWDRLSHHVPLRINAGIRHAVRDQPLPGIGRRERHSGGPTKAGMVRR